MKRTGKGGDILNRQAVNPYLPSYEYVPDGEPYVFGERVYLYGSHDKFNGDRFCMLNYVCWSAPVEDLADWRYEGVIYKKEQDPIIPDAGNRRLFAPDVQKGFDGRYYLYYAFDFSGMIGVAVCDTPAGAYEHYGYVRHRDGTLLGAGEADGFQYDPAVFADSSGKLYLYSGFCPMGELRKRFQLPRPILEGAIVTELDQDMITIRKEPSILIPSPDFSKGTSFEGHAFFEAASMRKCGDTYYFIYSSQNGHELCYATSKRPDGAFTYRGTIISNGDIGYQGIVNPQNYTGTNHGSIVEIKGNWYVFYHRQTNGSPYSRQGCAEKIEILEDGKIPQVEITSCGLNGGPLAGMGCYNAGIACCLMSKEGAVPYEAGQTVSNAHPRFTQDGTDREESPRQYIANMKSGAKVGFKYFNIEELHGIKLYYRSSGMGKMLVYTKLSEAPVAVLDIHRCSGWQSAAAEISIQPGIQALWFVYEGEDMVDFESFTLY